MATEDSPRKVFNDPIHGPIALHPVCVAIVNTPQFQRLRNIKQLGGGYYVYPAASHNRFEHSIGVCHLAGELIRALQKNRPDLISDQDVLCVEIAGLCHDLGHGPYSHVFDGMVIPRVPEDAFEDKRDRKTWKHENASKDMFDYIMATSIRSHPDPTVARALSDNDIKFVKNMICPVKEEVELDDRWPKKQFFYEIVANKHSEVDVDKWDYFARDCHHLGMRSSFDHKRYIHFARILEYEGEMRLCMRDKEVFNIYQLFQTRHALHKKAYNHKVKNAVECMIADILIDAKDEELVPTKRFNLKAEDGVCSSDTAEEPTKKKRKIHDCINDMDAYTNLTDDILQLIRASESQSDSLKRSQKLIEALHRRQIYSFVGETKPFTRNVPEGTSAKEEIENLLAEDPRFQKDRIIVQEVKLDFGKKIENPVNKQLFYRKGRVRGQTPMHILQDEVSLLVPKEIFQEQLIRVYLKQDWTKKWTKDWTEEKHKEECEMLKKKLKENRENFQKTFGSWSEHTSTNYSCTFNKANQEGPCVQEKVPSPLKKKMKLMKLKINWCKKHHQGKEYKKMKPRRKHFQKGKRLWNGNLHTFCIGLHYSLCSPQIRTFKNKKKRKMD